MRPLRVLAIEPYYGGSHQAFLDGWQRESVHHWTTVSLPPYRWKWRMRHGSVECAEQVKKLASQGHSWEVVFCSDMLNLAEFKGLCGRSLASIPSVVYFHENQLTYPTRVSDERDFHFGFSNFTTCLAAEQIWFNSSFHLREFTDATRRLLEKMPDYQPLEPLQAAIGRMKVESPGIDLVGRADRAESPAPLRCDELLRCDEPLHIAWVARWEHDKNPDDFFQALSELKQLSIPFRLTVLGESFRNCPQVFAAARAKFEKEIVNWGFLKSREDYYQALREIDVVVSTAIHEFCGLAILEAMSAGAVPLLPDRLSYPELLKGRDATPSTKNSDCLYDGSVKGLVDRLTQLAQSNGRREALVNHSDDAVARAQEFGWDRRRPALDAAIFRVASKA